MSNTPKSMLPATANELETYRQHMIRMFGDTKLPAIVSFGRLIPERQL